MTGAMTKSASGWYWRAITVFLALGIGGSARAQAPAQPGYPPAPVQQQPGSPPAQTPASPPPQTGAAPSPVQQANPPPPAQPGYPPPPPGAAPPYPPPQYPPQPAPAYGQQPGAETSGPPPGYAQPPYPPGGSPQPYPPPGTYQYPPGNYPQQPYGQPGYPPPGYPPAAYYPAPYPVPPPPPPPSTRPHGHGGLLLLPYVGIQAHEGASGTNQDVGLRLGSMIGYRFNGQFSLNAELTVDLLNLTNAPAGVDLSGGEVDFALSPLFHFDAGSLELAVGPKLGIWGGDVDAKDAFGTTKTSTAGLIVGANLGAFVPLGNGASLGGLISFLVRSVGQVCTTNEAGFRSCDNDPHVSAEKVLGITGAALF